MLPADKDSKMSGTAIRQMKARIATAQSSKEKRILIVTGLMGLER